MDVVNWPRFLDFGNYEKIFEEGGSCWFYIKTGNRILDTYEKRFYKIVHTYQEFNDICRQLKDTGHIFRFAKAYDPEFNILWK